MMTCLGIWSCQWRELRPIAFGSSGAAQTQEDTAVNEGGDGGARGDEEQGFGRGRGRGRGRDGAGEYEMVGMKADETGG
jgi:hypothetical protein